MWADESGGADPGSTATPDELLITVEGDEYSAAVTDDMDSDGVDDTAVIERADGTVQAFVDTDGDGEADEYLRLDERGEVSAHARFDDTSGEWVEAPPREEPGVDAETQTGAGGTITADMPGGDVRVGPATTDTDHDGVNDTAVVTDAEGTTTAFTDVDGDGEADIAVVIDDTGAAVTYEHTGDGEWTHLDTGGAEGTDQAAGTAVAEDWGDGRQPVEGVARIDATTGQWISQN
ncbi:hypothetical protein [Saccharomonospora saliphila]|uniref:hypothetical protein n=1 Tax=Saccharomonospora saliphila TaxID=369829 RepID=UPI000360D500|nr:hypothetical protein [Saccharomonospora saliphila]